MKRPWRRRTPERRRGWLRLARQADFRPGTLAELYGVTLRQMERYFQDDFGCSPGEWLQEQRMVAARQLLMESNSVSSVAKKLGFKQVSHFSREFKRYYNVTPSLFNPSVSYSKRRRKGAPEMPRSRPSREGE
ncbi:MAG: AraC-like DNA-binding protein [Limisphaerales bacterium]|jgi:AraC-like DNA-binding protein